MDNDERLNQQLDEVVDDNNPRPKRKSQTTQLIELSDPLTLFYDPDGNAYAEIPTAEHVVVWPVRSKAFRDWIANEYYLSTLTGCSRNCLADALNTIEARARFGADCRAVWLRTAQEGDALLIDLGDACWRYVKVTAAGWEIISDRSPVSFVRKRTMLPLPVPERGGSIDQLWQFLNVSGPYRPLVIGWLLAALKPQGPYPVLIFQGESGTAKSTASRIMRKLTDPSTILLKGAPRDERDFAAVAVNGWVTAFDNLSGLQLWQSDAICRLSTGGGLSARELYTNLDEIAIDVQRPVILNGIDDIATQPDLASRALIVALEPIPAEATWEEQELWEEFGREYPPILGPLFDRLVCALRNWEDTLDFVDKFCPKLGFALLGTTRWVGRYLEPRCAMTC
ncbi:MAG: hypothetical protein ACREYF_18995 [Gammaproteobacteria bacterium]